MQQRCVQKCEMKALKIMNQNQDGSKAFFLYFAPFLTRLRSRVKLTWGYYESLGRRFKCSVRFISMDDHLLPAINRRTKSSFLTLLSRHFMDWTPQQNTRSVVSALRQLNAFQCHSPLITPKVLHFASQKSHDTCETKISKIKWILPTISLQISTEIEFNNTRIHIEFRRIEQKRINKISDQFHIFINFHV